MANMTFGTNIIPASDNTYALGNSEKRWQLYADTEHLSLPKYLENGIYDNVLQPIINNSRANRLAFLPANQIIIEKTTDGGQTWVDAEVSDSTKIALFSEQRARIYLPAINDAPSTLCGLRVTFTAMKFNVPNNTAETDKFNYWTTSYMDTRERYVTLNSFYFWVSGSGSGLKVKIEHSTLSAPTTWTTVFNDPDCILWGWANAGYAKLDDYYLTFGGGDTQLTNIWNYRITFMTDYRHGYETLGTLIPYISEIRGYGPSVFSAPSTYVSNDHIYSFDSQQNVTFPANITATKVNNLTLSAGGSSFTITGGTSTARTLTVNSSMTINGGSSGYITYYSTATTLSPHADLRITGQNGTTSTAGYSRLLLGNSTPQGTANNRHGEIGLYADTNKYCIFKYKLDATASSTIYFPAKNGTVALQEDIVYSATEPSSPTEGMIWLQPVS